MYDIKLEKKFLNKLNELCYNNIYYLYSNKFIFYRYCYNITKVYNLIKNQHLNEKKYHFFDNYFKKRNEIGYINISFFDYYYYNIPYVNFYDNSWNDLKYILDLEKYFIVYYFDTCYDFKFIINFFHSLNDDKGINDDEKGFFKSFILREYLSQNSLKSINNILLQDIIMDINSDRYNFHIKNIFMWITIKDILANDNNISQDVKHDFLFLYKFIETKVKRNLIFEENNNEVINKINENVSTGLKGKKVLNNQ